LPRTVSVGEKPEIAEFLHPRPPPAPKWGT
jgi:hypothetical protein